MKEIRRNYEEICSRYTWAVGLDKIPGPSRGNSGSVTSLVGGLQFPGLRGIPEKRHETRQNKGLGEVRFSDCEILSKLNNKKLQERLG